MEAVETTVAGSVVQQDAPEAGGTLVREVAVTDRYAEVGDEGVQRLERVFEALSVAGDAEAGDASGRFDLVVRFESGLEGEEVAFVRDEDGDYAVEATVVDEDLLVGLEFDMDFTGLLPEGEVEEGAEWDLAPDAVRALLCPGGTLRFDPAEFTEGSFATIPSTMVLATGFLDLADLVDRVSGDARATYRGASDEEGRRLATVVVELDVDCEADRTELLAHAVERGIDSDLLEVDELSFETNVDGEATLVWDLDAGHFVSFELRAESYVEAYVEWQEPFGEDALPMTATIELSGTVELDASAE